MPLFPSVTSSGAFESPEVRAEIKKLAPTPDLSAYVTRAELSGQIPIFATLAEAEAWERANPGRTALTIESTEPDTTPPTLGTLTITPEGTKAVASVSGAKDDRGSVEYSFKLSSGAWSAWQASSTYTFTNLSLSTTYSATHRVRDRANNVVGGYSQSFTTLAEDAWGTAATDNFSTDGALIGRTTTTGGLTWQALSRDDGVAVEPKPTISGGVVAGSDTAASATIPIQWFKSDGTYGGMGIIPAYGAAVVLPSDAARVEMSMTVLPKWSTDANPRIWPIIGGSSTSHFTALRLVRSGAVEKVTAVRVEGGADRSGAALALPDSATTWPYNTATKMTVKIEGEAVEVLANGSPWYSATVPADMFEGRKVYGFIMDPAHAGSWLDDFSIRWE